MAKGARVRFTATGATGELVFKEYPNGTARVRFDDTGEEIWCHVDDLTEDTTFS